MTRRTILHLRDADATGAAAGPLMIQAALSRPKASESPYGPLQPADENGMQLPAGFTSRLVAQSGERVPGTDYVWHSDPDGGACFSLASGDWVYVSNSEVDNCGGGVGALRFGEDGTLKDAYRVLAGTNRNCAGGHTPWGS